MTLTSLILVNALLGTAVIYAIVRLLAAGIRAAARVPASTRATHDELRSDAERDRLAA